jgi:hypothetical protein
MGTDTRKAIVTAEHLEEARRLKAIWDSRPHPGQAEFGKLYEIGGQSAVSNFLRGESPLSLKAARGFAVGLGCTLAEFSPRLAKEAAQNAEAAGAALDFDADTIEWASKYQKLTAGERMRFKALELAARDGVDPGENWRAPSGSPEPWGPKKGKA